MVRALPSFFKETLYWAWTRDETHQPTALRKVLYFAVLYGSWLSIVITAGMVLEVVGSAEAAEAIWLFGVGFSIFMAVVDIAWEALKHLTSEHEETGRVLELGAGRELAPSVRIEDDTWIGFLVTVAALIGLMLSYSVVISVGDF